MTDLSSTQYFRVKPEAEVPVKKVLDSRRAAIDEGYARAEEAQAEAEEAFIGDDREA